MYKLQITMYKLQILYSLSAKAFEQLQISNLHNITISMVIVQIGQ